MTIRRVNHVVLSVSDLDVSTSFYRDVLGLTLVATMLAKPDWPEMRFFRSSAASGNHHDLAIIPIAKLPPISFGQPAPPGLFHVAFEVGTLDDLADVERRIKDAGAFAFSADQGMHLSVYAKDPDGISVELIWRTPAECWTYQDDMERKPLDLAAAKARWGSLATGSAAGEAA